MRTKKYRHLKKTERLEISILLKKDYGIREIARALNRSPGTISDEIKKKSVRGVYDPHKADHKAYVKRKYSKYQGMKIRKNKELRKYVIKKLKRDWSPEQIAGRLKEIDTHLPYASYEAIYKYIKTVWGVELKKYLRYKGKKKRKQKRASLEKLKNRKFIEERPEITNKRERFGDWEGDFIISGKNGKGVLLVLYERKSKYCLITKIMSRSPAVVNQRIKELIGGLVCFNSLTLDNDISFSAHKELSVLLDAPIFFCHPYHSWEKGGVENMNKLIRQYVFKGSDISKDSREYLKEIETKLNNRPRKCLGYKTPAEVMMANRQFKPFDGSAMIKALKQKQAGCSA